MPWYVSKLKRGGVRIFERSKPITPKDITVGGKLRGIFTWLSQPLPSKQAALDFLVLHNIKGFKRQNPSRYYHELRFDDVKRELKSPFLTAAARAKLIGKMEAELEAIREHDRLCEKGNLEDC